MRISTSVFVRRFSALALLAMIAMVMASGCKVERTGADSSDSGSPDGDSGDKITVAFVTNGPASFWDIAEEGCRAAEKDFNVECLVKVPIDDAGGQKQILQELITKEVDGVAVTPINPENQLDILNQVAEATNLITHDSDAPDSKRLLYIGMSNYDAGRMCGELVKEAMPDGGDVMIFVGRLGQLNADQRRQGLIDELLDRDRNPDREFDPNTDPIKGDKYTILRHENG